MKSKYAPINGVVEPDFLKYLEDTFSQWHKLWEDGVTLGTREIFKFENVLKGASLNAHTPRMERRNRTEPLHGIDLQESTGNGNRTATLYIRHPYIWIIRKRGT